MEIKVGQWVRERNGGIWNIFDNSEWNNTTYMDIIKVADTPQELVQVGDLVELKNHSNRKNKIIGVIEKLVKVGNGYQIQLGNITYWEEYKIIKILTPNENGDFIKQWESTSLDVSE